MGQVREFPTCRKFVSPADKILSVMTSRTQSSEEKPCQRQMETYMACVNSHPGGLKEFDCEEEKQVYRKCMKERKNSPPSSG
jgi:hypothetical protein